MIFTLEELLHDVDTTWMTDQQKEIYTLIANLLGQVYSQVAWSKMRSKTIATDVFEHRIKNSAHKNTVAMFINKLCSQLSIQALHHEPELIFQAEEKSFLFLKTVRTESQLCVMLARRYNQKVKELRKINFEEQTNEDN